MESRFDIIGGKYEAAIKLYPKARCDAKKILKLLQISGQEKILEITCGSGFLTTQIEALLTSGSITSQDISSEMVALAQRKINGEKVNFYLSANMDFPELKDGYFDKAVCLGGFHHIHDQVKTVKTLARLLKPGGVFVVGDFADNSAIQRYFDERVHYQTPGGHFGLFLNRSHIVNIARQMDWKIFHIFEEKTPFIFKQEIDIGRFFSLAHGLEITEEKVLADIKKYMGVKSKSNKLVVPMDYLYAKLQKQ